MNISTSPIIQHESATNTDQDIIVKFHNGPQLIVSGSLLHSSDNFKLIASPAKNKFYCLNYNIQKKEIISNSSTRIFDIAEYPSEIQNKGFLNISLEDQVSPEFDENQLNSFNLFEDQLADHLAWIDNTEHQDSENDAQILFDGEVLAKSQFKNATLCGPHCNLEKASVLLKLNPNEVFPEQYGLFCITYYVPSKHINDVDDFEMPEPSFSFYAFKDLESTKEQIISLENKENLVISDLLSKI